MPTHALTFSRGIRKIPHLDSLLGVDAVIRPGAFAHGASAEYRAVLGWGLKPNTARARRYAAARGVPYLALEDGFLRSVGLGVHGDPPLSVVIDDTGIYYDATRPSRLEFLLNGDPVAALPVPGGAARAGTGPDPLDDGALLERARHCMARLLAAGLSKYNGSPDVALPPATRPRVLVVDQTAGDHSIACGLAGADSFPAMLAAALAEHPDAEILIKVHPDVLAGRKRGHLLQHAAHPRVCLLEGDRNPAHLLRQVDHVYVVTSLTGFEAVLAGKPVTCFGAPFYAGWGLTDDRVAIPRRRRQRSREQVFAAAYLLYARYRDPDTGVSCGIEAVIDHLALQRHWFRENSGDLYCVGFTPWKRGYVRRYLHSPWNRIRFVRSPRQVMRRTPGREARIVVWGMRDRPGFRALAQRLAIPVWRIEDGFFRSVGLGSDFTAPASLAVDRQGIYFDAAHPSDLEELIQKSYYSPEELARARELRAVVVSSGLSKYNVGQLQPLQHAAAPGREIILVPGQVENDASIRHGCSDICTNAGLLHAVRERAPDAFIIYKPHPDVLSGNRDRVDRHAGGDSYDLLVTDLGITQCLAAVDEVHTMTSLVGFEGLLRGKRVVTYGMPFYAGWGLTEDRHRFPRRTRRLELDELVAACLIRYTRYLNIDTGNFTTPEYVLARLRQQRDRASHSQGILRPAAARAASKFMNLVSGLFYAR